MKDFAKAEIPQHPVQVWLPEGGLDLIDKYLEEFRAHDNIPQSRNPKLYPRLPFYFRIIYDNLIEEGHIDGEYAD